VTNSLRTSGPTELKVWERIILVVGEGADAGIYDARIEDFINGGILVTNPEFVSGNTLLRQGMVISVQVNRDDAAYQFQSRVHQHGNGSVKHIILTPPKRLQRVQRRMFVRVEVSARVDFALVPENVDWSRWEETLPWQMSRLLDISGGGVALRTAETIAPRTMAVLKIDFFPEAGLPAFVLGRTMRMFARATELYCGLQFILGDQVRDYLSGAALKGLPGCLTGFDPHSQDRLATYLFRKQVELRQKGLI
jgi:hypothetical protein